jgi:hypothetical protein
VRSFSVALAALALLLGGCGADSDRATARAVTDQFFAALDAGDGDRACAQLSPDTRSALEDQEKKPCRDAITGLGLQRSSVAGVDVNMLSAIVELRNGEAAFLDQGEQGWRLSAVGCKSQGEPADRPYDCAVED